MASSSKGHGLAQQGIHRYSAPTAAGAPTASPAAAGPPAPATGTAKRKRDSAPSHDQGVAGGVVEPQDGEEIWMKQYATDASDLDIRWHYDKVETDKLRGKKVQELMKRHFPRKECATEDFFCATRTLIMSPTSPTIGLGTAYCVPSTRSAGQVQGILAVLNSFADTKRYCQGTAPTKEYGFFQRAPVPTPATTKRLKGADGMPEAGAAVKPGPGSSTAKTGAANPVPATIPAAVRTSAPSVTTATAGAVAPAVVVSTARAKPTTTAAASLRPPAAAAAAAIGTTVGPTATAATTPSSISTASAGPTATAKAAPPRAATAPPVPAAAAPPVPAAAAPAAPAAAAPPAPMDDSRSALIAAMVALGRMDRRCEDAEYQVSEVREEYKDACGLALKLMQGMHEEAHRTPAAPAAAAVAGGGAAAPAAAAGEGAAASAGKGGAGAAGKGAGAAAAARRGTGATLDYTAFARDLFDRVLQKREALVTAANKAKALQPDALKYIQAVQAAVAALNPPLSDPDPAAPALDPVVPAPAPAGTIAPAQAIPAAGPSYDPSEAAHQDPAVGAPAPMPPAPALDAAVVAPASCTGVPAVSAPASVPGAAAQDLAVSAPASSPGVAAEVPALSGITLYRSRCTAIVNVTSVNCQHGLAVQALEEHERDLKAAQALKASAKRALVEAQGGSEEQAALEAFTEASAAWTALRQKTSACEEKRVEMWEEREKALRNVLALL